MKKIFGVLLIGLAIVGSVGWIKNVTQQKETKSSGSTAYDQGQKAGRYSAPVVFGGLFVLGLRLLFSSDDAPSRSAPIRRNPASGRPASGDSSLRGAQGTYASNPARLRIKPGRWLAANPLVLLMTGCLALIGIAVLFIKLPVGIVLIVTAAVVVFQNIREAKQKFWGGDVCAGVVLSAQQNLVAVYTDLIAGGNVPRPAIRIVKQPLHRMTTEVAYDGMRVATAALYAGDLKQAAWRDFSPEVINCVVHDPDEIARVLGSISDAEWQALDTHLARLPVTHPGLYRMWGDHLAVDATPWIKRKPVVIGLSVLVALAAFAALMNLIMWQGDRARERREASAPAISPPPPPRVTTVSRPVPETPPLPPVPRPVPTSLELGGKIVTVTNISGRIYENIKLVRAEPGGIIYTAEGGGGKIPLANLPPEFLDQLGVPTSWLTSAAAAGTAAGRSVGLAAGARVSASWGGKWVPGTITKVNPGGFTFMVQLDDARFPHPIVLSTNQFRLQ